MFDIIMLSVAVLTFVAGVVPALQSLGLDTRLFNRSETKQSSEGKGKWWLVLGVVVVGCALSGVSTYRLWKPAPPPLTNYEIEQQWRAAKYQEVWNQHYINQTVPLDGYAYENCTFENVTFSYNGTAPAKMDNATMIGKPSIDTANPAIKMTFTLMTTFFKDTGLMPNLELRKYDSWDK